jgi:hypothetical protein
MGRPARAGRYTPPVTVPPPLKGPSRGERVVWVLLTAGFLLSVSGDRASWLRGPAPYPPEWQWPLREGAASGPLWPALAAVAAILGLLALSGTEWARSRAESARRLLLGLASVFGLALPLALVAIEGGGVFATIFGRVAYRTATSYYTVAISPEADDPIEFLRRHHELLPTFRRGAKHAATHPPGPVLVYRGLVGLCAHVPGLTSGVLRLSGLPETNPRRPRPEHAAHTRAAGVLGAVLILVACALTAWPIAGLARAVGAGPLASARLGILWTLMPGPVVFLPQFDQALALPVAISALALARALRAETAARAAAWSVAAGLAGGIAAFLSYGAPAFLAIGGVAVLAAALASGKSLTRAVGWCALAALVTAMSFAAPALVGHHPIDSMREALRIHREFFTAPRDYAVWLVFDPLDVAVFMGLPVAASLAAAAVRATRRLIGRAPLTAAEAFRLGALAALLLLLLSGQTRGEVGRIWIPIMPVLLVAALARPTVPGDDNTPSAVSTLLLGATLASTTIAIALSWKFF